MFHILPASPQRQINQCSLLFPACFKSHLLLHKNKSTNVPSSFQLVTNLTCFSTKTNQPIFPPLSSLCFKSYLLLHKNNSISVPCSFQLKFQILPASPQKQRFFFFSLSHRDPPQHSHTVQAQLTPWSSSLSAAWPPSACPSLFGP